jgi:formylglycine-generating enzyme required for sulfatase activity
LLLSLGEFDEKANPPEDRQVLLPKIRDIYCTDSDPGIHGSAEWLLRRWQQQAWLRKLNEEWAQDKKQREQRLERIQQLLNADEAMPPPQWYVNGQGQTMVVLPGPVQFLMGSPVTEVNREGGPEGWSEMQHIKRISRSFAIAAKEVTVEQFLRFRKDHPYDKQYAPTLDCPVNVVSWYGAAAYCNWLSKEEGIPEEQWCYAPAPGDKYEEGMRLAPNYLHRTGYRLPSEAEWEYACRAGTVTSRYYGETEELLDKYAWYTKTSRDRWMLPCGSLKPNDLGLFDMLGNAQEWCQEQGVNGAYKADEDVEDTSEIKDTKNRVTRGGSFTNPASSVRAAYRRGNTPIAHLKGTGFRPARTISPSSD